MTRDLALLRSAIAWSPNSRPRTLTDDLTTGLPLTFDGAITVTKAPGFAYL